MEDLKTINSTPPIQIIYEITLDKWPHQTFELETKSNQNIHVFWEKYIQGKVFWQYHVTR